VTEKLPEASADAGGKTFGTEIPKTGTKSDPISAATANLEDLDRENNSLASKCLNSGLGTTLP
jgi:hypothetical protein